MKDNLLFDLDSPLAFIMIANEESFAVLYNKLNMEHKTVIIRMIRGRKSKTIPGFHNEISAVLQFPYYFGENSAALNDCLTDLEWIQGDAYLLMINNSEDFLSDVCDHQFNGIMEILSDVQEQWLSPNEYFPRNRQPTPFHLLFQCAESNSHFIKRIKDSGVSFQQIE